MSSGNIESYYNIVDEKTATAKGDLSMDKKDLEKILLAHTKFVERKPGGKRADLSGANLSGADHLAWTNLARADLSGADLTWTNLAWTNLAWANLSGANLYGANLYGANLAWANLSDADLSCANLAGANLARAQLVGANLSNAELTGANLYIARLSRKESIRQGMVLAKPMTGYKKTYEGVVIKVEIPAGAVVFSINNSKCRANMATIVDMGEHEVLHSAFVEKFAYRKGQKIVIKDFDLQYNVECAPGFHFFRTLKEAKDH